MKINSLIFLIFFSCFTTQAQRFSVVGEMSNILYAGIDNPLSVVVENLPDKKVILKSDNGKIRKGEDGFMLHPDEVGTVTITVYKKEKEVVREVGRKKFRVHALPDPIVKIGTSAGGDIEKLILQHQEYLRADRDYFGICANFLIDSFTICIMKSGSSEYTEIFNAGNKLSAEVREALHSIRKNDTLIFKRVYIKGLNGKIKELRAIVLNVI